MSAPAAAVAPFAPAQDMDIPTLLRSAVDAGVRFRLSGAEIAAAGAHLADPDVMAALHSRRDELWRYLGGQALDQPSLDLMATRFKHIEIVTPQSEPAALKLIAQLEADADAQSERFVKGVLGLDIETAANAGEEERQYVHLRRDGVVVQPTHAALEREHLRHEGKPGSTAGLDPYRSTARLMQLYGGGDTCLVLDTRLVPLQALAPVLGRRRVVSHNAAFELRFLHHAGIDVPRFECSMQAARLMLGVYGGSRLEDVALSYLGIEVPKELQLSDWGTAKLSPGQLAYAALDAIIAWQLWPHLLREIAKAERAMAYLLCRDAIPPIVRMQERGVLMDTAAHHQQIDRWHADHASACGAFRALANQEVPTTPAEIRGLLECVLPPEVLRAWPRTEKKSELSTAAKHLLKQTATVPALAQLCAIKKAEKLLSSFGDTLTARVGQDGRVHAGFNIAAAKTGRMSSSDPNMQQIPRDKNVRNCFVAQDGYAFVLGDYTTMELRAVAEISGDAVMRKDFADGVDLHERLARQMHGIPAGQAVPRELRQAAKPINFGTIYGAGGAGLAESARASYGVVLTPAQAEDARDRFLDRYSAVRHWMYWHKDHCQRQGYIAAGRYGRVIMAEWESAPVVQSRPYDPYGYWNANEDDDPDTEDEDGLYARSPYGRHAAHINSPLRYTLCCNAPVQGACADIIMRAVNLIDRMLTEAGIPGGLVLAVHDELVLEVPADRAEEAARLLRTAMEQAFAEYFGSAPINGLMDVHTGKSWGEAKA
jgi:DNA polymerase I-like protein with 3'-5' exonuclease and polymerase domains